MSIFVKKILKVVIALAVWIGKARLIDNAVM
jgi:pantothenate synthetase